jgi:hypothetical protein
MMPLIVTGPHGVTYHGFPPPVYGAWTQVMLGSAPHYYEISGTKFHLKARPPGTQYYYPYLGPIVPFSVGRITF